MIIRNPHQLIHTNEKFIVKHDYENIIEPSKTMSQGTVTTPRTDIPSNIAAPSVRTKSGCIIRKSKRYLEECWIVKWIPATWKNQVILQRNHKQTSIKFILDQLVKLLRSKRRMLHYRLHYSCFISFPSVHFIVLVSFYFLQSAVHLIHFIYHDPSHS